MTICLYCKELIVNYSTFQELKSDIKHFNCFKIDRQQWLTHYTQNNFLFDKVVWNHSRISNES